jgi:signal transduction histidine kinase
VRIRAESVSQPDGVYVRIAVEDRGPGVSPEDLPHIFEPFQRGESVRNSQIPGVGLGLSLVRRIVEAHRGSVHAENSPEGGAIFYIDLPAESEQARPAAEIEEAAS